MLEAKHLSIGYTNKQETVTIVDSIHFQVPLGRFIGLLGPNGIGKSSILEAIGLALFDGNLRSTNSAAVRYGEKSALVSVKFVGVDENV